MRLIIAEKPKVGRAIAAALGIKGGSKTHIRGAGAIVTWCIGHLGGLAMPEDYDQAWKSWRWEHLPILPEPFLLKGRGGKTRGQLAEIRKLMRLGEVTEIVNAADAGREGELIFDLVYRLSGCKKPVLRLWTASLTEAAIREAYARMKPASAYADLRDAARSRQEADWLVGINCTRAQTLATRAAGMRGRRGAMSVGRVQTPTLRLIYDRDEAIRTFVPEDFWTLLATFHAPEGDYEGQWYRKSREGVEDRFKKQEEARAMRERLKGKPAEVAYVGEKEVRRLPDLLYDLTTLQRACNKRFGFSAEKTLSLAQSLYEEHQVLSYPRTGSRHLTGAEEAGMERVLKALASQEAYVPYVREIEACGQPGAGGLGRRFVDASKVEDHHAIIPTEKVPSGKLSADERKVYDLVARRVLAMYYPPLIETRTTVITRLGAETFKTFGKRCKQLGFAAVDPPTKSAAKKAAARKKGSTNGIDATGSSEEERSLPPLRKGQRVDLKKLRTKKGQTRPPKPYSEGDLLGAMETAGKFVEEEELKAAMKESGLGTPATRASIIETLLERGFIHRRGKTLACTDEGRLLIETIPVEALKSPALTGEWEARLSRMSRGDYDRAVFMGEVAHFTREAVAQIKAGTAEMRARLSETEESETEEDTAGDGAASGEASNKAGETEIRCDRCGEANYARIPTRKGGAFLKCSRCGMTRNLKAKVTPEGCRRCGATAIEQDGPYGRYRSCVREECSYSESTGPRKGRGSQRGGNGRPRKQARRGR